MELFRKPIVQKMILILGIAVGIYFLFTWLVPLVIPFLIALFVAFLLQPLIRKLEGQFGMQRKVAVWVAIFIFVLLLILICTLLLRTLIEQGQNVICAFPFYQARFMHGLETCCSQVDKWFQFTDGASYAYMATLILGIKDTLSDTVLPELTTNSMRMVKGLFDGVIFVFVAVVATVIFTKQYPTISKSLNASGIGRLTARCGHSVCATLGAYMRAQVVIMIINAILFMVILRIIGSNYWLILAVCVAVLDSLPLIGSGLFLLPWALVLLLMGMPYKALIILVGYIISSFVRESVEPRLVGDKVGISTITSLICMYVGLQIFGVLGFLFGPVAYLLGKEIYSAVLPELQGFSCNPRGTSI